MIKIGFMLQNCVIMLLFMLIDMKGFNFLVKWYQKDVPRKGVRRQKEYLETDFSPETSAYQNSTHLLHLKKKD